MSAEENRSQTYRWFEEVWNQKNPAAIDALMDADCLVGGIGETFRGTGPFKQFHAMYCRAFPDMRIQVDQVVAEGEWTAQRFSGTATHTGAVEGMAEPTGQPVRFTGMSFGRWQNGKMVEAYNNLDLVEVQKAVGLL